MDIVQRRPDIDECWPDLNARFERLHAIGVDIDAPEKADHTFRATHDEDLVMVGTPRIGLAIQYAQKRLWIASAGWTQSVDRALLNGVVLCAILIILGRGVVVP